MSAVKLTKKDIEVLQAARMTRRDTFLPWLGAFGRSRKLAKAGLLKEAGTSVLPPYVLYVITEAGRTALAQVQA